MWPYGRKEKSAIIITIPYILYIIISRCPFIYVFTAHRLLMPDGKTGGKQSIALDVPAETGGRLRRMFNL
jgi:hypothetical protein